MPDLQALSETIQSLPADRIAEIEDFVAFIAERERLRAIAQGAAAASEPAFAAIWSNAEDDAYDAL